MVQLHDAGGVEGGDPRQPGQRRDGGRVARVEDDERRGEGPHPAVAQAHRERLWLREARLAEEQLNPRRLFDAVLAARAEVVDDLALALAHPYHIHLHGAAGVHAIVGATPREIGHPRARHHRFGGRAALVDAGAADMRALDDGRFLAGPRERRAEWPARLPRPDDDRVELLYFRHVNLMLSAALCSADVAHAARGGPPRVRRMRSPLPDAVSSHQLSRPRSCLAMSPAAPTTFH